MKKEKIHKVQRGGRRKAEGEGMTEKRALDPCNESKGSRMF
jgi:hypothetical protein